MLETTKLYNKVVDEICLKIRLTTKIIVLNLIIRLWVKPKKSIMKGEGKFSESCYMKPSISKFVEINSCVAKLSARKQMYRALAPA